MCTPLLSSPASLSIATQAVCRDIARMDDDGYVSIEGRMKDLIIRGGENIYPAEVEQFLYKHPKIADVQVIHET